MGGLAETGLKFHVAAALVDIEGTISPLAFVKETLFPYAAERLRPYVEAHRDDPRVADLLVEVEELNGDDPLRALEKWQHHNIKVKPLKTLQGWIWAEGYAAGAFAPPLFEDALEALRRWRAQGLPLYVYSSGSLEAQELLFRHSAAGDVRGLFEDFYDTSVGSKLEAGSYLRIAAEIGVAPRDLLFLSDNPQELVAAELAGLQVAQVVKDAQASDARFAGVRDFGELVVTRKV